jgi:predicted transcriptional regulator
MTGKEQILSLLQSGEYTRHEIQAIVKMTTGGTNNAIKQLRNEGLVYVARWERQEYSRGFTGNQLAVYRAGTKRDAKRIAKFTKAEVCKAYRTKYAAILKARYAAKNGQQINPFAQLLWSQQ